MTIGEPVRVNAVFGASICDPVTHKIELPNDWDSLVEW